MPDGALVKKLQIKPGYRLLILNPPPGYQDLLCDLPPGTQVLLEPEPGLDFVQFFARDGAELKRLAPEALRAVKHDGLLWVTYPKQSSGWSTDLNREQVWALMTPFGVRPVAQIAVDEVWSALRFRPQS